MSGKNKIEVIIGGCVYTLQGQESQEYMQKVALYIDKKMNDVKSLQSAPKLSTAMVSILTSINVADDFLKAQVQNELLNTLLDEKKKECDSFADELAKQQQENLAFKERIEEMRLELLQARMELQDYIETFDEKSS